MKLCEDFPRFHRAERIHRGQPLTEASRWNAGLYHSKENGAGVEGQGRSCRKERTVAHASSLSMWQGEAGGSLWACNLKRRIYIVEILGAY